MSLATSLSPLRSRILPRSSSFCASSRYCPACGTLCAPASCAARTAASEEATFWVGTAALPPHPAHQRPIISTPPTTTFLMVSSEVLDRAARASDIHAIAPGPCYSWSCGHTDAAVHSGLDGSRSIAVQDAFSLLFS